VRTEIPTDRESVLDLGSAPRVTIAILGSGVEAMSVHPMSDYLENMKILNPMSDYLQNLNVNPMSDYFKNLNILNPISDLDNDSNVDPTVVRSVENIEDAEDVGGDETDQEDSSWQDSRRGEWVAPSLSGSCPAATTSPDLMRYISRNRQHHKLPPTPVRGVGHFKPLYPYPPSSPGCMRDAWRSANSTYLRLPLRGGCGPGWQVVQT